MGSNGRRSRPWGTHEKQAPMRPKCFSFPLGAGGRRKTAALGTLSSHRVGVLPLQHRQHLGDGGAQLAAVDDLVDRALGQ